MAANGYTAIVVYNSAVAGLIPSAGNLATGELALNAADGKLYYKNSNTNTVQVLANAATSNPTQINTTPIFGAPSATENFYIASQSNVYYATNATTNFTLNIAASPSITLNTFLAVQNSFTIDVYVKNGATPYTLTGILIDGVSTPVLWESGTPPTGTANAVDQYTFTVIKTASATFTVFGAKSYHA